MNFFYMVFFIIHHIFFIVGLYHNLIYHNSILYLLFILAPIYINLQYLLPFSIDHDFLIRVYLALILNLEYFFEVSQHIPISNYLNWYDFLNNYSEYLCCYFPCNFEEATS